jgi:hypothetical protein
MELPFYVTNLGWDRIILGLPWFQTFEPLICWKEGTVTRRIIAWTATKIAEINKMTLTSEWAIMAGKNQTTKNEDDVLPQYQQYADVFSKENAKWFPPSREEDHEIKFTEDVPKFFKNHVYSMSKEQMTFLQKWIDKELKKGFIRPSKSQYPSPMFLIKKKNNDYRVVQDYQQLNKYTIPDWHPLPLIAGLIKQLHRKQLFTKFDIRMGYNNIRIREEDRHKVAFTTPLGQFKPTVMSFGLCNALGTFVRTMNRVFRPLLAKYPQELLIYMDNILVATTNNIPRHRQIVREVLETMRHKSFFLKTAKCEFEQPQVKYLGLLLDGDTIRPDPSKVAGLKEWPWTLKSVSDVHQTLGLLNYHRAFVPGFSHIVKPLTTLLKKDIPFRWTSTCTHALDKIINVLTSEPVLTHPNPDKPFELEVDALNFATGAILFQQDNRGKPRPLGFHSKTLSKEEMNYDIYDKELTVLDRRLDQYYHLLLGQDITVHTDHTNLTYYQKPQKLSLRAKWAVARIMQYNICIRHKPGILNKADALSRQPDFPHQPDSIHKIAFPDNMFIYETSLDPLMSAISQAQEAKDGTLMDLANRHTGHTTFW